MPGTSDITDYIKREKNAVPTLDQHDLLVVCLSAACLGLIAVSIAAGMRTRSAAGAMRAAGIMLVLLLATALLGFVLPTQVSQALLIVFAAAVWISRWPYLVGKARMGSALMTIPDQTGPRFTVPAGALMVGVGLLWMAAKPASPRLALLPFLGISMLALGIVEGLNFLFPIQIGSAGILDPYSGLARWDNIESYWWSPEGDLLELRLRSAILFRRRSLAIPPGFRQDVAAYLSHRLWGAEEPVSQQPLSAES